MDNTGFSGSVEDRAAGRTAEVARVMGVQLTQMASALHIELADAIPELRGDATIIELL